MKYLDWLLLVVIALVAAFHVHLFKALNAAPLFDAPVSAGPPPTALRVDVDECRFVDGALRVTGWMSHPAERSAVHATTVVLRRATDGRVVALNTDLLRWGPTAVAPAAIEQRADAIPTGFVASLKSGAVAPGDEVSLAYQQEGVTYLVPLGCTTP